jgi:hypothetical protein
MPTSVFFIPPAPGPGGGYELVPPGGGVDETMPVGGGVVTGAMPTKVLFMADAPGAGGDELRPPGPAFTALDEPAGGGELVVPVGGGVDPCGATPTSVFFIAAAAGDSALIGPEDWFGRGGRIVAPHTPHVAVSGFAGDPQRGQTLMPADYFPCLQNAMA